MPLGDTSLASLLQKNLSLSHLSLPPAGERSFLTSNTTSISPWPYNALYNIHSPQNIRLILTSNCGFRNFLNTSDPLVTALFDWLFIMFTESLQRLKQLTDKLSHYRRCVTSIAHGPSGKVPLKILKKAVARPFL